MNWKKHIATGIFWTTIMILTWYIGSHLSPVYLMISVAFYASISYCIYRLWKYIRRKTALSFFEYILYFLNKSALSLTIIALIVGSFLYYHNSIAPASMPSYTITNGEKTIIFQTMIHIATPEFYEKVEQNIYDAKSEGYVYFYEGVGPWSPESNQKFNQAIGVDFDAELYDSFSKLYWVVAQDQNDFLGIYNNLDFNVDMNLDEIIAIYESKKTSSQTRATPVSTTDLTTDIVSTIERLNDRQLSILIYINQAILNAFTKHDGLRNTIISAMWSQDIFWVILDDRDQLLAESIASSPYDKIFITYGLLHFKWVFEQLKDNDPRWEIVDTQLLFPI